MKINGLQKLTLLDYPGQIACTVFLGGCNMRCPFCHNGALAEDRGEQKIEVSELLAFLDGRVGRLQGVCISGGEPTIHKDLPELIREVKSRGFLVKLDTNGTNPEMLSSLIDEGLLDYVAMDIKNSPERYAETAGLNTERRIQNAELAFPAGEGGSCRLTDEVTFNSKIDIIDKIRLSAEILMGSKLDFEFRTTLVRELHSAKDIISIGKWLAGSEKYFLQTYRDEGDLLVGGFSAFSGEETKEILEILREYIPNAEIR